MRMFLAVWLSQRLKTEIADYLGELQAGSDGVRWAPPEQLHFTLAFLGEHPPSVHQRLSQRLPEVARRTSPFRLALGEGGWFPERGSPRVLWLGVSEGRRELTALAAAVRTVCADEGIAYDNKPIKPHLTLGRIKTPSAGLNRDLLLRGIPGAMTVQRFSLVESVLKPSGSVYRDLETFSFESEG